MNNQRRGIKLEEGWSIMQKGITKLQNLLEGVLEQQLNSEEHWKLYSIIYNMCTQNHPQDYSRQLYGRYKESLEKYVNKMILPSLREKQDEFLLREFVKGWDKYQIFGRWLSHLFNYLNQHFIPNKKLPALTEVNLKCFRDLVYAEMKSNVKDAVITLIDRERDGGHIDRALLKNVLGIFLVIGMDGIDAYECDFELAMLTDTAVYYSKKAASWIEENSCPDYMLNAEECLEREKERVGNYMHASSEPKLLKKVQHELLTQYVNQLLDKVNSGCQALLREDKVEDLSRMCRLFSMIPKGMEPFAAMFRQHVTDEGRILVKQAEATAGNKKAGKKERQGAQEQAFVRKVIELHEKYSQYVSKCFGDHLLFQKALMEAFELLCNKTVAGSTGPELLVTFCDNLLKKGASERLSEEAIENTLEKVVKFLPYICDKDLFAGFYRKKLARRLLYGKSSNYDQERSMLTKVKQQCGGQFTSKMEGMLTDLVLAREIHTSFEKYRIENCTSNREIDLTVTVLNSGYWPSYKSSDLAMPAEMVKCVEVFKEFYKTKTKQRKLTWIFSLGTCSIIGHFDPKPIELIATTYQASVLLLFNEADKLSYADIKGQLNLEDEDIERVLHSLSCGKYKILNKDPSTNTVTQEDSFEYNLKFTDRTRRITIPVLDMEEKKKIIEDANKDRRFAIDASIVRIMKSRKILSYQELVAGCFEQLGPMFKPDVKIIKKRIEDLIGREFLERDKDNFNTFRYLA